LHSNLSQLAVGPGHAAAPGMITADHAEYTKRNPRILRVPRSKNLRPLNIKFSPPIYGHRPTTELSHARPSTQAKPRLPGKPEALPGVGSSDLDTPIKARPSGPQIHTSSQSSTRLRTPPPPERS